MLKRWNKNKVETEMNNNSLIMTIQKNLIINL